MPAAVRAEGVQRLQAAYCILGNWRIGDLDRPDRTSRVNPELQRGSGLGSRVGRRERRRASGDHDKEARQQSTRATATSGEPQAPWPRSGRLVSQIRWPSARCATPGIPESSPLYRSSPVRPPMTAPRARVVRGSASHGSSDGTHMLGRTVRVWAPTLTSRATGLASRPAGSRPEWPDRPGRSRLASPRRRAGWCSRSRRGTGGW